MFSWGQFVGLEMSEEKVKSGVRVSSKGPFKKHLWSKQYPPWPG